MNKRFFAYISLFTVLVCLLFVNYNPNIATDLEGNFTDGEVFMPQNHSFDFRDFSINCTTANNFTVKTIGFGHTQFIDDTGDITINYVELDKMIRATDDETNSILGNELEKPSWTVDGVLIHRIQFLLYDDLYSAYEKNSTENTIIYLSTPNEQDTADMMNSLSFKEE